MNIFRNLFGKKAENPELGIYGKELRRLRNSIRKNSNRVRCYICGELCKIDFSVIEQLILNNRRKEFEMKGRHEITGMSFVPNLARDGAICKHCKGIMCPHCAELKLGDPLTEISLCPLCGNMVYGIDHITD